MAQPKKKPLSPARPKVAILGVVPAAELKPAGWRERKKTSHYDDLIEAVSQLREGEAIELGVVGDLTKQRNAIYAVLRRWLESEPGYPLRLSVRITENDTIGIYCKAPRKTK